MNTFNNFSPLAFREKSMKATYKKWYAYGKEFALPFSTTELPPFQFTVANLPSFDPTTVEVSLVDEATGTRVATGIKIKVDSMDGYGSVLYVSPGSNVYAKSIEPGVYRAEFAIPEGETYVSTPICVTDGIETNTNFVKLEYWNDEKLAYPNGFVTTGTDNDFKFQMYIPTTFFKPKYEFEEEITKRAGYKFLELQTCNKVFGFNFLAPEYICDALRLVRLSDYIRFTHDGEYYNALNFEYNPDWQDNGYLAAIECQFETDTIIQKLPSFNRRDRESFYNALLADIETPILFSPDTVGLYYREFKQGEPTIKGKLIRELSPIDLIDENTTIAVDMGAGEARKFNLFKTLEGYISKNHEDVTEFLLSLRGGVNIGTPNTSGEYPASVDRDGNATLNNVTGKEATFKTVETGFLTVNKTSATIDGMGNANVTDLTARGDSMLRSDVYTGSKNGSHTGKITKEGQLQYLSAIIYEFLSSETFVPGFLGEGFKIWLENGNWYIECDNLTVRQTMNIFELLIQKIRSVNGAIVVSQSNGKVTSVEDTGTQYKITFGEEFPTFQEGDLIRCQSWSKNNIKFYWVEVKTAADGYVLCDKSEFNNVVPAVGDEVVQMGNTKNPERQALIYITAQESGHPYIEILNGVKTKSLSGTNRTRLGDLSNIQDSAFPEGQQPSGSGLYCDNAFLRGIFLLRNGKSVEDEVNQAKQDAANAATGAERAQQTAQEAKDRLNKWADDGFISPTEKPALIDEGKRIQAEYLQIKANADKYGVPVTEYTEAYNNYLNELRYHSAATPEDIAVRPELAQSQTIYYDRRNGALNAIADAAKSYVDEADKKLKEYLDTEITAIPGKIELAVRSLKVANVNLLLNSNRTIKGNPYKLGYYRYDVHLVKGKSYTLTVCYKCADSNTIYAYNNPTYGNLAAFPKSDEETIVSKKITPSYDDQPYFYFYKVPQQETTQTYVKWAVITEGDIGVTQWIPSASERGVGIKNLCSFKRIVDAGFTYLRNYEDDGRFYVDPGLLNQQTNLANKDMFGLTYDPTKQYYIFIDKVFRSDATDKASIYFIVKYTDGTEERICVVYSDSVDYNYLLSSKPISKIVGSYSNGYGGSIRVGVFETNTPVTWSPAPEDQLYQSVKYTDTQILAVDGKIELSVKTQLEKSTIGGENLLDGTKNYWFNESDYISNVNLVRNSDGGITGIKGKGYFNSYKRWMPVNKSEIRNGREYTVGIDINVQGNYYNDGHFWVNIRRYNGSEEIMLAQEQVYVENKPNWVRYYVTVKTPDSGNPNDWLFLCGFSGENRTTNAGVSYYYRNINMTEGSIGTSWSPSANDTYNKSVEYTTQQISIVEGKISLEVSKEIQSTQFGGNNLFSYTSSPLSQLYSMDAVDRKTDIHGFYLVGKKDEGGVVRIPNVIPAIPGKYTVSGWIKGTQSTPVGFYIDVCDSSRVRVNSNASNTWSYFKHTFDVTKNTEAAHSTYNFVDLENVSWAYVWVKDFKVEFGEVATAWSPNEQDPVYKSAEYTNGKIDVTNQSITAAVQRISATENRLTSAELKLTDTSAKLSVVEGTANDAKTTAGTASNKAEAADGRVTATQNGLVETGINITSRKIVLKSDNVLFQNNAGQQTAAINANGKLTANAIEVGEVVANGFAAQRITTGNLTVTDGAVIAGMSISGGVLRGGNVELTNGAKIGRFVISNGIFSAQDVPAGIQMTLSNNVSTFDSGGVKIDHNSGGYALTTNGNGRVYLKGSAFWTECQDYEFIGATSWKAPGVFYAATILSNGKIGATWGNPDFSITRVDHTATGSYTIYMSGYVGHVFPTLTCYDLNKWAYPVLSLLGGNSISYKTVDTSRQLVDCGVCIHFCGMV
jgi:hypothetical protein